MCKLDTLGLWKASFSTLTPARITRSCLKVKSFDGTTFCTPALKSFKYFLQLKPHSKFGSTVFNRKSSSPEPVSGGVADVQDDCGIWPHQYNSRMPAMFWLPEGNYRTCEGCLYHPWQLLMLGGCGLKNSFIHPSINPAAFFRTPSPYF